MKAQQFTNKYGVFTMYEYSDKCVAIVGETKAAKTELKKIHAKYCPNLCKIAEGVKGWVISLRHKSDVLNFMCL